jgi:hypothetical protein
VNAASLVLGESTVKGWCWLNGVPQAEPRPNAKSLLVQRSLVLRLQLQLGVWEWQLLDLHRRGISDYVTQSDPSDVVEGATMEENGMQEYGLKSSHWSSDD